MRIGRIGLLPCLVTVAAIAVFTTSVAAASASQFTVSTVKNKFPQKIKGEGVGNQFFKFGKIEIDCPVATASGEATEATPQLLKVTVRYKECEVPLRIWAEHLSTTTHFVVEYLYHADGLVQDGSGLSESAPSPQTEVGSGSITIGLAHTGHCTVSWEAQTIPASAERKPEETYTAATYTPQLTSNANLKQFPTGFQTKLLVNNAFAFMTYTVEEAGLCENFEKTESNHGRYEGQVLLEDPSGNLGFE